MAVNWKQRQKGSGPSHKMIAKPAETCENPHCNKSNLDCTLAIPTKKYTTTTTTTTTKKKRKKKTKAVIGFHRSSVSNLQPGQPSSIVYLPRVPGPHRAARAGSWASSSWSIRPCVFVWVFLVGWRPFQNVWKTPCLENVRPFEDFEGVPPPFRDTLWALYL